MYANLLIIVVIIIMLGVMFVTWRRRNNAYLLRVRDSLIPLDPRFGKLIVQVASSSYTDKSVVYICIHDENGNLFDENTLRGVLIHEMAHVLTPFYDPEHKSEVFRNHERDLLLKAKSLGLWTPEIMIPCDYCGVDMTGVKCLHRPGMKRIVGTPRQ